MNALQIPIPRRSFLHGLTALAAAGFMPTALAKAVADAIDDFGNYTWAACVINCGNRCPLRVYTKAGKVIRIETDNTIKDSCHPRQIRACLKGRSMRQRLYSSDRLRYPMKRVGERGEAKFERISLGTKPTRRLPSAGRKSGKSTATNPSTGTTAAASSRSSIRAVPGSA